MYSHLKSLQVYYPKDVTINQHSQIFRCAGRSSLTLLSVSLLTPAVHNDLQVIHWRAPWRRCCYGLVIVFLMLFKSSLIYCSWWRRWCDRQFLTHASPAGLAGSRPQADSPPGLAWHGSVILISGEHMHIQEGQTDLNTTFVCWLY